MFQGCVPVALMFDLDEDAKVCRGRPYLLTNVVILLLNVFKMLRLFDNLFK